MNIILRSLLLEIAVLQLTEIRLLHLWWKTHSHGPVSCGQLARSTGERSPPSASPFPSAASSPPPSGDASAWPQSFSHRETLLLIFWDLDLVCFNCLCSKKDHLCYWLLNSRQGLFYRSRLSKKLAASEMYFRRTSWKWSNSSRIDFQEKSNPLSLLRWQSWVE